MKRALTALKIPAGTLKAGQLVNLGFTIARKGNKYRNTKCEWRGEKFDSKRELERHLVLLDMQQRKEIHNLKRQVKFRLTVNGWHVCFYIADWTYEVEGQRHIEDCKGYQTPEFKIKWALAKAVLGPSYEFVLS